MTETSTPSLGFAGRVWLALACFWRILVERAFAEDARQLTRATTLALPGPPAPPAAPPPAMPPDAPRVDRALQLLAILQQEGRFVDFLEQDVAGFSDADVGAAARVVHEGCRRALRAHAKVSPVRSEDEGARVTIASGFSPEEVKLTGNVTGTAPFTGILRHRGWRATDLALPTAVRAYDASVLAPAEVEL